MSRQNNYYQSDSLWSIAWRKLKADKLAMTGFWIIILAMLIAVLGGLIRMDSSKNANEQNLPLARNKPGFKVSILQVTKNSPPEDNYFWNYLFFGGEDSKTRDFPISDYKIINDSIFAVAYTGDEFFAGDTLKFNLADVAYPVKKLSERGVELFSGEVIMPEFEELATVVEADFIDERLFILGTDKFGRDLFSRIQAGTIVSLSVGFISVFISLLIGVSLGAIAGYYRGWIDDVIMWLINVIWSIPTLLLVIAITFALGKGFTQVFIAVGLTMWVEVARVVRGQVMGIREKEFVEAGKALGYSSGRIISKHIIPNAMSPVIVISAANFASAILIEAGLSFLGIGAQVPMPSWGQMIKENYAYITTDMAYLAILPGVCIMILVLAFMLLGNGLRDALDTRALN